MLNYFKYFNFKNSDKIKKTFILKYEINGKDIIVFFADNTQYKLEHTKDNEIKILKRMKEQINQYKQVFDEYLINDKSQFKYFDEFIYIFLVLLFLGISCFLLGNGLIITNILGLIFTILGSMGVFGKILINVINKIITDDYKKTIMFLENEVVINEKINSQECKNIFMNVNNRVKDACPAKDDGSIEVTINSIDRLNLCELKLLVESIKKETFIFSESKIEELEKEKSNIKILKR